MCKTTTNKNGDKKKSNEMNKYNFIFMQFPLLQLWRHSCVGRSAHSLQYEAQWESGTRASTIMRHFLCSQIFYALARHKMFVFDKFSRCYDMIIMHDNNLPNVFCKWYRKVLNFTCEWSGRANYGNTPQKKNANKAPIRKCPAPLVQLLLMGIIN